MEILQNPSKDILDNCTTKFEGNGPFRIYRYVYQYVDVDYVCMYNLLTNCIIALTTEEYKSMHEGDNKIISKLIQLHFLVGKEFNDYEEYIKIRNILRNKFNFNTFDLHHINHFSILSTYDCNARCEYCYEKGFDRSYMNEHTTDNIIRLIKENYELNKEKIQISLFGGEPLFYQKPFNKIFNELQKSNIEYNSDLTTNGYLLNDKCIDKIINLYKVNFVQITIDDIGEKYNKIKKYINKSKISPYQKVINNIHKLAQTNKCQIYIRINFDPNEDIVNEISNTLRNEFKDYQNVHVYIHELFNNYDKETQVKLIKILEKEKALHKPKFEYAQCMADNNTSMSINPNGDIYKCNHCYGDDGNLGNINDYYDNNCSINYEELKYYDYVEYNECKDCCFKPQCIIIKSCQEWEEKFRYDECPYHKKIFKKLEVLYYLKQIYNNFKNGIM